MISTDDILGHLKGRLEHPFLGTFTIALLINNWRYILTATTGDLKPADRIAQIEALWKVSGFSEAVKEPLLYAVAIALCYPILNAVINIFYHWVAILEGNAKSRLSDTSDLTGDLLFKKSSYIVNKMYQRLIEASTLVSNNGDSAMPIVTIKKIGGLINDALVDLAPIWQGDGEKIKASYTRLRIEHKE